MSMNHGVRVELTSMDAYLSLFGANGRNLPMIESELDVALSVRGSELTIEGEEENAMMAARVVEKLMDLHQRHARHKQAPMESRA